jgi:uncharacterized BrkB/YihY/UPF0761 family membrane protein
MFSGKQRLVGEIIKETSINWNNSDPLLLSPMVAYYAVFSLPRLLLVAITITMYFMGQDVVEGKIYGQANELMEDEGAMKL